MAKEMLINVSEGEECRIALLDNGRLEELYMERTSSTSHVGNIYKGRVTNVEASIQAAFVDFGLGRNGFLHISDLMPTYFGRKGEDIVETVGKKMARRDRPPIQRCLRRGDEIIVQIIKEGIGTKGPTLSSYLSIPGRYLVMMPGVGKLGVSQKIEDETERRRLRQILDGLKPPKDVGFIIRTAGVGKSKLEIERDLKYLTRLWEQLEKKRLAAKGPAELYAEGDLVTRTVRDFFSADVDRIVVDNEEVATRVKEVIKITTPRTKNKVELYEETVPLFHKYGIEREIEQMYSRHVPLPSGGSLVIDSTEAIVAIDVNSGKFREHNDAEMTAFKTDMEAADEIPRQLKLRDLGGVIICDFIDLRYERNRRELEKRLHDNFKNDRAKTKVLRMSQFGIIEMTRQRMRASLKRSIYFDCPHCKGAGLVKTHESMSLDVMRRISIAINDLKVARVELAVCPDVAFYLQNKNRRAIAALEDRFGKRVLIRSDAALGLDEMKLELFDNRDGLVMLPELDAALSQPTHKTQLNTRPHGGQGQQGRGGQGGGAGRSDGRRDQGRRGPQQQQGQLPPPGRRTDEDEERMDDRFRDDDEAEETASQAPSGERHDRGRDNGGRGDGGGGGRSPQQQHRQDDRGRHGQQQQGRGSGDRGGDRGGRRPQQQQPQGRQDQFRDDRQRDRNGGGGGGGQQGQGPAQVARDEHGNPLPGQEGGGRRRRRRRGRRGRGRGQQQEGQMTPHAEGQRSYPDDQNRGDRGYEPRAEDEPHEHQPVGEESRFANEDRHDEDGPGDHFGQSELLDAPAEITDDTSTRDQDVRADDDADNEAEPTGAESEREDGGAVETESDAAVAEEAEPAEPARGRRRPRGGKGRSRKPAANEPKAETPEPAPAEEPAAAAPKSRRRGSRGGRGRGKKATAAATSSAASEAQPAPVAQAPVEPSISPRRRAASADKHLVRDEPVIPEPVRRPRSSRDLDEIPDDLD